MKAPNNAGEANIVNAAVKKAAAFVGLTFLVNWSFTRAFHFPGG